MQTQRVSRSFFAVRARRATIDRESHLLPDDSGDWYLLTPGELDAVRRSTEPTRTLATLATLADVRQCAKYGLDPRITVEGLPYRDTSTPPPRRSDPPPPPAERPTTAPPRRRSSSTMRAAVAIREETIRATCSLSLGVVAAIDRAAERQGVSRAAWMAAALEAASVGE